MKRLEVTVIFTFSMILASLLFLTSVVVAQTTCPTAPTPPTCASGQYSQPTYDANNCVTGYTCVTSSYPTPTYPTPSCPTAPIPPSCASGQYLKYNYDSQGCLTSYTCETSTAYTYPTPPSGTCGNNVCEGSETSISCPTDCGTAPYSYPTPSGGPSSPCGEGPIPTVGCNCGGTPYYSGYCCSNVYKTTACGTTTGYCGDKICSGSETSSSCPSDCGTSSGETCGNNFCGSGETPTSCPSDCKVCGEGPISSSGCQCGGVTQYSGYCCNSVFQYSACGTTTGYCGDKICSGSESAVSCPTDCGGGTTAVCGNKVCEGSETVTSCPSDCGTSASSCSSANYWYCYDQSSCTGAGAKWCAGSSGSTGYCTSSTSTCPSYTCDKSNTWNCKTEAECKGVGAYWYNNYCSSSPPPQCSSSQVWNCYDQTSCTNAGGYWYNNYCSSSPPPKCTSTQKYNCYDQTSCQGAAGKWCTPQSGGSGWCSDSCPTYTCDKANVWNCKTEAECKTAGGYWYNNYCSSSPPPQCTSTQKYNCYDQTSCKGAGGNWCPTSGGTSSGYCSDASCPSCSSSQAWNCYDQTSCQGAGGNWCKSSGTAAPATSTGWCSTTACPTYTCDKSSLWNCYDQSACQGIGGNWCLPQYGGSGYCSSSACPVTGGFCGDKICSGSESATSCPSDCGVGVQPVCKTNADCPQIACFTAPCPTQVCKEGKCVYETQPPPSIGYCGWCGDSCSRITPTMYCQAVVPPSGFKCLEENGVCVKKAYEFKPPPTCPVVPAFKPCLAGHFSKPTFDVNKCITGYECVADIDTRMCPPTPPPTIKCLPPDQLAKTTDLNGCVNSYYCASTGPPGGLCPDVAVYKPQCTDGSLVPLFDNKGCSIGYNCIPQGCRQEFDPKTQTSRVVCDKTSVCPADEQQLTIASKCAKQGGKAVTFSDPSGCKFVDCRFTDEEILPDPIKGHTKCPTKSEVESAVSACKATGLAPAIAFEGGCKIAKCTQQKNDVKCQLPTPETKLELENQCSAKGLPIVKDIDPNGCAFYRCGEDAQDTCAKEVPAEAFEKCQAVGGEMVVKKDEDACVVYANCISRGDERDTFVELIEEVPEATELLGIALKLEKLKVELAKLSDEAENIASFYAGRGDDDEERFNRIASMFESAAERVDEIREGIRSRLDSLTVDDVIEIKRDIKHLREVTLKDIVYMMLSNSDEVKDSIKASKKIKAKTADIEDVEESGGDCGTDGLCFDRAFRICNPVTFNPEGSNGPTITVIGLDGATCIVKARLPDDMGPPPGIIPGVNPPYEMTCKFKEYSFGVRGPEDFIPHCEGPMAELMKQFGGPGGHTGGADFPPPEGGPGGCTEIRQCAQYCLDNYDDCVQWTNEHPAYGSPPPREELGRIASGEFPAEFERRGPGGPGPGRFEGPGGCKGPSECDKFCRNSPQVCYQWCLANPDICPQDKLQGPPPGAGGFGPEGPGGFGPGGPGGFGPQGPGVGPGGPGFGGQKCPDDVCDAFEQANPNACPQDCGGVGQQGPVSPAPVGVQACVGCLNNGVCDIGECSECVDCLRR